MQKFIIHRILTKKSTQHQGHANEKENQVCRTGGCKKASVPLKSFGWKSEVKLKSVFIFISLF